MFRFLQVFRVIIESVCQDEAFLDWTAMAMETITFMLGSGYLSKHGT